MSGIFRIGKSETQALTTGAPTGVVSTKTQGSSATTNGSGVVTVVFPAAFSTIPAVVTSPTSGSTSSSVSSITATGFIITGALSVTYNWIAVGT